MAVSTELVIMPINYEHVNTGEDSSGPTSTPVLTCWLLQLALAQPAGTARGWSAEEDARITEEGLLECGTSLSDHTFFREPLEIAFANVFF